MKGRSLITLALFGFVLMATGVIWRRSMGMARAREESRLEQRRAALRRTDRMIGALLERTDPARDLVLAFGSYHPSAGRSLGVLSVRGVGTPPGYVETGTTRRAGYVALQDIAPSILDQIGVEVPEFSPGGGFSVAYRADQTATPYAEYAAVIDIDLAQIKEPIVCCPNDPDDAKFMSEVAGTKIDEAFIGSCMTNIGHFRAASKVLGGARDIPVKLWVAPPTKMDETELVKEGHYATFGAAGARTEMPGCSLCMGNQAQVREGATVVSTSTRNFPNRLGKNTQVFLTSAELAAVCSKLGRIPTVAEYQEAVGIINKDAANVYKYLNFDQIEEYAETAKTVKA